MSAFSRARLASQAADRDPWAAHLRRSLQRRAKPVQRPLVMRWMASIVAFEQSWRAVIFYSFGASSWGRPGRGHPARTGVLFWCRWLHQPIKHSAFSCRSVLLVMANQNLCVSKQTMGFSGFPCRPNNIWVQNKNVGAARIQSLNQFFFDQNFNSPRNGGFAHIEGGGKGFSACHNCVCPVSLFSQKRKRLHALGLLSIRSLNNGEPAFLNTMKNAGSVLRRRGALAAPLRRSFGFVSWP